VNPRTEFLVQLAHYIDDLANKAADLGCDPDEITRLENNLNRDMIALLEAP